MLALRLIRPKARPSRLPNTRDMARLELASRRLHRQPTAPLTYETLLFFAVLQRGRKAYPALATERRLADLRFRSSEIAKAILNQFRSSELSRLTERHSRRGGGESSGDLGDLQSPQAPNRYMSRQNCHSRQPSPLDS